MRIRISTVKFDSHGSIDCRKCHRRSVFPEGVWALFYDYGTDAVIQSAQTLAVLHACGRVFVWQCNSCFDEPDQRVIEQAKRRGKMTMCLCGGEIVQARLTRWTKPEEAPPEPATPF